MTLEAGKEMDKRCVLNWLNKVYVTPSRAFNEYTDDELKMFAYDCLVLLKEQEEEHKRLLSWLSKFCRHIDNGDKWLTDEENLDFFRKKMKQQFGWDTD